MYPGMGVWAPSSFFPYVWLLLEPMYSFPEYSAFSARGEFYKKVEYPQVTHGRALCLQSFRFYLHSYKKQKDF